MSDKLQRNDNRTPTSSTIDKEAATEGCLESSQVKIHFKQEQPVLITAFQKRVGGESRNHPYKCWPLPLVDKSSQFSSLKYFSDLLSSNLH